MTDELNDKFLMINICGSRAYNLDTDSSDMDYVVMVTPFDFPEIPEDRTVKLNPYIGETDADYFAYRLDSTLILKYLAGAIYSYPKLPIGGSCEPLISFWKEHHAELLDIAPGLTYDSLIREVAYTIDTKFTVRYCISVRNLALLMCRYETGSMIEAVKLNDMWRDRYYAMKRGNAGLEELTEWYKEATTDVVKDYFNSLPVNNDLFEEYKKLVTNIVYQRIPEESKIHKITDGVIENYPIAFESGSRAYGLEIESSDKNHVIMATPSEFPDIPEDRVPELSEYIGESGKGYFIHRLDYARDLANLAGWVYSYPKPPIGGNNDTIVNFWAVYHDDMLDIAPAITYDRIMSDVRHIIGNRHAEDYPIAVRNLGILMCRYETGRMIHAVKLNGLWRERYFAMKNGVIGIDELMSWYEEAKADSIKEYFENIPTNYDLLQKWQDVVDAVI